MTVKQSFKRFLLTSFLMEVVAIAATAGVFYFIYMGTMVSNDLEINNLKSKFESLQTQERDAIEFLDKIESSSDEKKRNVIRKKPLEAKTVAMLKKISSIQPHFEFTFLKTGLDDKYVNLAHIHFNITLKDKTLDNVFYGIYGKILEKAFSKIQSKKIRELVKISDREYKIIYKKDYI